MSTTSSTTDDSAHEPAHRVTRRQLLKAGAWAAPVIAVAAAAPAASASNPAGPPLNFDNFGDYFTDDGAGHRNGLILNGQVSVAYDNSGPNFTGFPVGNVTMVVTLPAAWFSVASTVTLYANSADRWTRVGSPVLQGANVIFTFLSVAKLTTTGPLSTGNLTVGFSSTVILPAGTEITLHGLVMAPDAKSVSGERTLIVP